MRSMTSNVLDRYARATPSPDTARGHISAAEDGLSDSSTFAVSSWIEDALSIITALAAASPLNGPICKPV